ncbi:MAG: DUF998 domain-containing protein [Candidatus Odinarchaeota archaeon]
MDRLRKLPRGNMIGIVGPLISFICILISTLILSGFDWASNALSDLGSWFRTDLGNLQIVSAIVFNGGLIVTGLMIFYFIIWLVKQINDLPSKIVLLFFAGSAILLAGIGVFSEDFSFFHFWTAVPFFFSIPIALGLVGLVWIRLSEMRVPGIVLFILSLMSVLIMFQGWMSLSIAVFETIEAIVMMSGLYLINYIHFTGRMRSIQIAQTSSHPESKIDVSS